MSPRKKERKERPQHRSVRSFVGMPQSRNRDLPDKLETGFNAL